MHFEKEKHSIHKKLLVCNYNFVHAGNAINGKFGKQYKMIDQINNYCKNWITVIWDLKILRDLLMY